VCRCLRGWGLEWEFDGVGLWLLDVLVGSCGNVCLGTMDGIDQHDRDGECKNGRRLASVLKYGRTDTSTSGS
jgi:hypothetical protein